MHRDLLLLLSLLSLWPRSSALVERHCEAADQLFSPLREDIFSRATLRQVDQQRGSDQESCLNREGSATPPPCRSLQFALHESQDTSVGRNVSNLWIELGPGVYRSVNESNAISDSHYVAIIGAGISKTLFVCGANGSEEVLCEYPNARIANSSHVYLSGITFTGCGPITSSFYIGTSDIVLIENCSFENNISPPVLIYNSPNIKISGTKFLNNHPRELNLSIASMPCYFQPSENLASFLDNRTTSGGISHYSDQRHAPVSVLIEGCTFSGNSARDDSAVTLVRRSEHNGQGGAVNLRLVDSHNGTVCIRGCSFTGNVAEAHAGALAVSMGASSSNNKILVEQSTFEDNSCFEPQCTGGAVGIGFYANTRYNSFLFRDSNFTGNQAQSSGAMVIFTSVSAVPGLDGLSDSVTLRNCWFVRNQAFFEGTALGAYSISHTNLIGIPVNIQDCHFDDNRGSEGSEDTTAVTVYRVLLSFYGTNTFTRNRGGGTSLLSSRMDVRGRVQFHNNTAVFGAGVAMSGRSLILLHEGAVVDISNNFATETGAGLYVETTSSDFILSVLNTGCFIRYNSSQTDLPPTKWNARVTFRNNSAVTAGAAIYANDMSRCRWLGPLVGDYTIFEIAPEDGSPFLFEGNTLMGNGSTSRGNILEQTLATNPSVISARSQFRDVSYGEDLSFFLSSSDQFDNFREAVWSLNIAGEEEGRLGSLSSNRTVFRYKVPERSHQGLEETGNETGRFNVTFTLLQGSATATSELRLTACHPGYYLNEETGRCSCLTNTPNIVRCDSNSRYFYTRDGFWVGVNNDSSHFFANTVPGFLNCSRLGSLPGCLFKYDQPDEQCAIGRRGMLCGECLPGFGVSFDLRFCLSNCGFGGILLFIAVCIIVPVISLAILYFDFPLPNELKGVIFYAQVVGVIYRSTPYLSDSVGGSRGSRVQFFDFLVNFLGFAMPFPVCLSEYLPVEVVAFLGYIPPLLALTTAVLYIICARRVKKLSHRENYGFHGFYLLFLFIYKYIVDTSFIFVSCSRVDGELVFLYQGTRKCLQFPFVLPLVFASIVIILFGIVLPLYVLKIIYAPQKLIHVRNSLTHGLKNGRQYIWYGVWDIWRRLLFVGFNLFISVTTRSVVLFMHSMLVLLCLTVLCVVKPYKKYHINVMEGLIILCLFSTTLSIYDRDNDLYVGSKVATVSIFFPFAYGLLFILYRGVGVAHRHLWPRVEKRWHLWDRVEKSWAGRTVERLMLRTTRFMEEREANKDVEEFDELEDRHRSSSLEDSYTPQLREALLEDPL